MTSGYARILVAASLLAGQAPLQLARASPQGAEAAPAEPSSGSAPPSPAAPDSGASKRALALFAQSKVAYQAGRFGDAIALLREAYGLSAEPVLLYNLARAHEGKGELDEAVAAYEQYLAVAGEIPDRAALEKRRESLKTLAEERRALRAVRAAEEARAKAAKDAEADEGGASRGSPSLAPWVVAGAGGVVLGVGVVVGVAALGANDAADQAPSQQQTAEDRAAAEDLATVSTVLLLVGGVTAVAGVTWGVFDLATGSAAEEAASTRLVLGPTGATVHGAF